MDTTPDTIQDTDTRVAEYLAAQSITFTASYRGVKQKALDGDRPMDEWECVLGSGRGTEYFEYFTGLGLRKAPKRRPWARDMTADDWAGKTAYGRRRLEEMKQPVAPTAAAVLYCLIADSRACSMSFSEWCYECGYDEDSRRAESIYFACEESGKKLRAVFTRAQIETLSELLEDY